MNKTKRVFNIPQDAYYTMIDSSTMESSELSERLKKSKAIVLTEATVEKLNKLKESSNSLVKNNAFNVLGIFNGPRNVKTCILHNSESKGNEEREILQGLSGVKNAELLTCESLLVEKAKKARIKTVLIKRDVTKNKSNTSSKSKKNQLRKGKKFELFKFSIFEFEVKISAYI